MRICLLFLSLLLGFIGCPAQVPVPESAQAVDRHAFSLEMKRAHLSGILLTKDCPDEIVGTLINEFGITALSFSYSKASGKMKLYNVAGFLNKWYIKRLLKADLRYCIQQLYHLSVKPSKNYHTQQTGPNLLVTNKKRDIRYSISPLQDEAAE